MSRPVLAAVGALCVALAACGTVLAQDSDAPSARWVSAVAEKGRPAVAHAKSDRVSVREEARPAPVPKARSSAKVVTIAPIASPARVIAPIGDKPSKRTSVRSHSKPLSKGHPKVRNPKAVTPKLAVKHVHQPVAPKPVKVAISTAKPKTVVADAPRHRGGRPDVMALAARDDLREKTENKEGSTTAATAISMIIKLVVVLALAYLTVRVLKWFSDRKPMAPRINRNMKIVDTIRLSNTNSVHLITVKGKSMLVGCSAGQVSLLGEFEGEQQPESEDTPVDNSKFAEYLAKYSGASNDKTAAGRMSGLLKDCATYLRTRQLDNPAAQTAGGGDTHES